jgi:hypothetical protein
MADENQTALRGRSRRTTFVDEDTWAKFGEFKAAITGRKGEISVARSLSTLGVTQLDHLARASDSILVIEIKTYGGYIVGSLDSAQWVQHLAAGERGHVFQNPIRQNHRHCRAVETALAGLNVPIAGIIVSAGSAVFCDELQGSVVPLPCLGEVFRPAFQCRHDPRHLDIAWQRLIRVTADAEPRREEHLDLVRERRCFDSERQRSRFEQGE